MKHIKQQIKENRERILDEIHNAFDCGKFQYVIITRDFSDLFPMISIHSKQTIGFSFEELIAAGRSWKDQAEEWCKENGLKMKYDASRDCWIIKW